MRWRKPKLNMALFGAGRGNRPLAAFVRLGPGPAVGSHREPSSARSIPRASWQSRISVFSNLTQLFGAGRGNRTPDSTLGRSRLTTKLYPRILTCAVYVGFGLLAILALPAKAAETPAVHFDSGLVNDGKTLILDTGAKAAIFPHALPNEADVTWTVSEATVPTLPADHTVLGSVYRLTITGVSSLTPDLPRTLAVVLPRGTSYWKRQVWMYDPTTQAWSAMSAGVNPGLNIFQAKPTSLNALYAVLEDRSAEAGIASWYCRYHCSPRYPKLHGTSNDFPVGSYVTVTSTETKRSVTVKIISGWGQPAGRIIDLSYAAYSSLKTKNVGVTNVTVSPAATPAPDVPPAVTSESIPNLKVTETGSTVTPTVTASSYVVYDQGSGTVLASQQAEAVAPIASLTKLMTAMVALDQNVVMSTIVTYRKADITPYAYLRVNVGDTLSIKDTFYSMIVGSANNAATLLARSTGLTRAQFVDAMNTKAASWGLAHTHFVDVNGLDPANVSSASDLAVIASHAFHDYPQLRAASLAKSYTFTTRNTKQTHSIKSTDKLLLAGTSGLSITGGKTGFLDEAKYTYILRSKNTQGAQVITVVLGAPSSALRFQSAAQLSSWAWANYQWS